jgi:hypothetical protein
MNERNNGLVGCFISGAFALTVFFVATVLFLDWIL